MRTLDQIPLNHTVRMVGIGPKIQGFRHKLLAMGFIPGIPLTISGIAPLGSPIQVTIRGYTLSLRKIECQQIQVEYLNDSNCADR